MQEEPCEAWRGAAEEAPMAVLPRLGDLELLLLPVANDEQASPWTVMVDLQVPRRGPAQADRWGTH
jgi:hypothetical protein